MSTDTMIVLSNIALFAVTALLAFVTVEDTIKDERHDNLILKVVRLLSRNANTVDVDTDVDDHHGRHEATDHYGKHAA